jgi:predicted HD phosphohydrolase
METKEDTVKRANFKSFAESTREDWQLIVSQREPLISALPSRVTQQLELLRDDFGGFPVDRLEHSLQTATRAERDGRNDEYVMCALIHDIGDVLTPHNHPDLAAAVLKPFVSEENHWMVAHHDVFQGYYFWHHLGGNRNARDAFEGHEFYDHCEEFCRLYDAPAFDSSYDSNPLEHYIPLINEFFTKNP